MYSQNYSSLIRNICQGSYNPCELSAFVNISQKIAVSYLKYQEVTGKNISFDKRGTLNNLDDMAVDCIATLFMRDERGNFVQLRKYFSDITNNSVNFTNDEILVKLRGLVIKKTKQELSRIFRERDPEGAKILRNIRVALKTSADLGSFRDMGREFIFAVELAKSAYANPKIILTKTNGVSGQTYTVENLAHHFPNLRRSLPAMPELTLKQEFLIHFTPKDPVSTIIRKMLMVIAEDVRYQNFLALDVAANIIRAINLELFHEQFLNSSDSESPLDSMRHKEIDMAMQQTSVFIKNKLEKQYVKKNKLDPAKARIYYNTLFDMINDLAGGKATESNYNYLKRHIPSLSQVKYRKDERSIFEYLVKLTKSNLIKKLKVLL